MDTKDAYKQKLNAQLKEWSAQIKLLSAKVENKGADVNLGYAKELEEIRRRQEDVARRIKELDEARGDAWETIKGTTEKVVDDLKTGIAQALSRFK